MTVASGGMWARIVAWGHRNFPTRETLAANRLLRPVADRVLRPELWRFTRRSVPRGVALGMVIGILAPGAQTPLSAVLALPLRANIPVAALTTFVTNPLTTPPLWIAAYWIGRWILRLDAAVPGQPIGTHVVANAGWLHWLVSEAGPATLTGLLVLSIAFAVGGYWLSALAWRLRVARKWRQRRTRRV